MTYFNMNELRAAYFANASDGYEGVTHAGIAVVRFDGGTSVLLTQRADDPTDDPEVRQSWEFPGGGLEPGETPWDGAVREFSEEVGFDLPPGRVINGWRSPDGVYQGFVYEADEFPGIIDWVPTEEVQAVAWVDAAELTTLHPDLNIRPELRDFDTSVLAPAQVSGNEEDSMSEQAPESTIEVPDDEVTEPMLDFLDVWSGPIPIHGVMAPEETESGDARGFAAGAVTTRPLRIPFSHQKSAIEGHGGSVVVGSVDRLMRKDGLIHWEGLLMPSVEAGELLDLIQFFGRFGVSIDGDRGSVDVDRSSADGVLWFDAVRASGLTAVAIPAFAEAYVALGPHPDMPPVDSDEDASLAASGMIVGARGPGWVTNPKSTSRIHDYWMPGHPGGAKIRWGTDGDYTRCTHLVGEKIAANSPEKAGYIKQVCAQWHHDALGYWPGDLGKPGNPPDTPENRRRAATHAGLETAMWEPVLTSSGEPLEQFKNYDTEQRRKMADQGHALPDGSFPIGDCEDLRNAIQSIGRASDPAKAKALIRRRNSELGCNVDLPWSVVSTSFSMKPMAEDDPLRGRAYCCAGCGNEAVWSVSTDDPQIAGLYCNEHAPEYEDQPVPGYAAEALEAITRSEAIETDDDGDGWEAVLTSSMGTRALPPSSYFERHEDTGALVIDEPDANGLRRTYGYAGEWGVCHIGIDGRCVELPEEDGDFPEFHLGRTKTSDAGYINTGVITYKVDHRGREAILTETAEQQHYDNVAHAWAAVRLGTDERGVWFSGVVLPNVPEEDIVLIEAAGQVSGEWKYGALRALQAVNVPGFAVLRSSATYDDDGNVEQMIVPALAASALAERQVGCYAPEDDSPAAMMAALAKADAEVRFQKLRSEWEG